MKAGSRLKELRLQAGYRSIRAFCKATGLDRNTIAQLERGRSWPSLKTANRLANVFSCTVNEFMAEKPTTRFCPSCQQSLPLERFNTRKGRLIRRQVYNHCCRQCEKNRSCQRRAERKALVIEKYGGACACCGEKHLEFLAIDHINGSGRAHRKAINRPGSSFYYWLIQQNFPSEFRVLCANCNTALGFYGYCPHGTLGVGIEEFTNT